MAHAAQEVVFRSVELDQLGVLGLDPGEQLGVPDRDGDLAGVQLEQVLIGPVPLPRRGEVAHDHAELFGADVEDGSNRQGLAGDPLLRRHRGGVDEEDLGVDQAERGPGIARGTAGDELGTVSGRAALERFEDPPELAVPPLEVAGQPVVGLRQAGELVLAGDDDRRRQVAGRRPLDGSRDGPQGCRQIGGQQIGEEDGGHRREDQDEQQDPTDRRVVDRAAQQEDDRAENRKRGDRGSDEAHQQPRPERQAQAEWAARNRRADGGSSLLGADVGEDQALVALTIAAVGAGAIRHRTVAPDQCR